MKKASTRPASPFNNYPSDLPDFQVKHIHYQERSAVEQNDMPANQDMLAIRRRRRQMPLQVPGTNHNLRSQPGRQSATHHQLALQPRWQAITLGQTWRQVLIVFAVPAAHLVAIVVGIGMSIMILIVASTVLPAVLVVDAIFLIVTVSMVLSDRNCRRQREPEDRASSDSQPHLM